MEHKTPIISLLITYLEDFRGLLICAVYEWGYKYVP